MDVSASFSSDTYSNDALIAGTLPTLAKKKTLLSGQNCVRGTVLGIVMIGAVTAAAIAGNTGTGALTGEAVSTSGNAPKVGVYKVIFVEAETNLGTFVVEDPDGIIVAKGKVGVLFDNQITFTIADGTDFIAGDGFTVTVAAGSGKYKKSATASRDGSQVPAAILAQDCDATSGDEECLVFERGDFNERALTFGTGHTADTVRATLRALGIWLIPSTQAEADA
jgi:hypothetical protein